MSVRRLTGLSAKSSMPGMSTDTVAIHFQSVRTNRISTEATEEGGRFSEQRVMCGRPITDGMPFTSDPSTVVCLACLGKMLKAKLITQERFDLIANQKRKGAKVISVDDYNALPEGVEVLDPEETLSHAGLGE